MQVVMAANRSNPGPAGLTRDVRVSPAGPAGGAAAPVARFLPRETGARPG
jgi:hypothetical protein